MSIVRSSAAVTSAINDLTATAAQNGTGDDQNLFFDEVNMTSSVIIIFYSILILLLLFFLFFYFFFLIPSVP